jgi:hypothetical protein
MWVAHSYEGLQLLDETDELVLGHRWETAYLLRKQDSHCLLEADFYGEPSCGYISRHHTWAVVAGEQVVVWHVASAALTLPRTDLQWIHAVRLVNPDLLELLTDPWGEHPAIWRLAPLTGTYWKISDFLTYQQEPYTDHVRW